MWASGVAAVAGRLCIAAAPGSPGSLTPRAAQNAPADTRSGPRLLKCKRPRQPVKETGTASRPSLKRVDR